MAIHRQSIIQRETFVVTRAARVILGLTIAASLGAAVAASPMAAPSPSRVVADGPAAVAFKPLSSAPAIDIRPASGFRDEDCSHFVLSTGVRSGGGLAVGRGESVACH